MIVKHNKYSNNKKGRLTVIKYLLDALRVQMGQAYVLKGDPKYTERLIDNCTREHTYASGGLMFDRSDSITEEQEQEIMNSFEEMVFVGLDKSQYHILWVKHVDKGRTELNFVIPRTELSRGVDLDIYSHTRDLPIYAMWKNGINKKYGLADPNAESRKRTAKKRMEMKKHRRKKGDFANSFINERMDLDTHLQELVSTGVLTSRKEIMQYLKTEGYEVKRAKGGRGLIVSAHHLGDGVLELKGRPIYHKAFESLEYLSKPAKAVYAEIKFNSSTYQKYLQRRSDRHLKRYGKKKTTIQADLTPSKKVTQPIAPRKEEENDTSRAVARRSETRDIQERADNRGTADSVQSRVAELVSESFPVHRARDTKTTETYSERVGKRLKIAAREVEEVKKEEREDDRIRARIRSLRAEIERQDKRREGRKRRRDERDQGLLGADSDTEHHSDQSEHEDTQSTIAEAIKFRREEQEYEGSIGEVRQASDKIHDSFGNFFQRLEELIVSVQEKIQQKIKPESTPVMEQPKPRRLLSSEEISTKKYIRENVKVLTQLRVQMGDCTGWLEMNFEKYNPHVENPFLMDNQVELLDMFSDYFNSKRESIHHVPGEMMEKIAEMSEKELTNLLFRRLRHDEAFISKVPQAKEMSKLPKENEVKKERVPVPVRVPVQKKKPRKP